MKKTLTVKIEDCLKNQSKLVDEIYALQKAMYSSVLERDWLETEKLLRLLDELSQKFVSFDKNLHKLIQDNCQNKENADFFECTKNFSQEEKEKLNALYSRLKKKLFDSKIENDAFSNYITHAQSLAKGIVDMISEDRNGKCYTDKGQRVSVELTSLVLNQAL